MTTQHTQGTPDFTTLMLPAVMRYPHQPEEFFPMRHGDWKRIRARVASLQHPLPYLGQVGWASVGLASSAIFTLIPWSAAYAELPLRDHVHYAWVFPLLMMISMGSIVIAAFCLSVNFLIRHRNMITIMTVLAEMDDIYDPHARRDD